jgi:hypothetical protein
MPSFLKVFCLLVLLCQFHPTLAGRCTGSAYCSACKNCSACKHCNGGGGTCGVCGGGDSYRKNLERNSPADTKTPDDNPGSSYEQEAPSANTLPAHSYPATEEKESHPLIWILVVLLVLYIFFKRKER